ncbi:MAG: aminopeptidase N [Gammaproteobacteria bacterium]|nr:aminopeptidase N [Gammaproteobacteria bacterium]
MLRDMGARTSVHLEDYTPPPYFIDHTRLDFELDKTGTIVSAELDLRRNPSVNGRVESLELDGVELELLSIAINGAPLAGNRFQVQGNTLMIDAPPAQFTLATRVRIHPENNTALSGLYKSSGNFCTQCEAEGFRRITWYLDRPDVLSQFTTRVEAARSLYPLLLSNGNLVESGKLDDGRHFSVWKDPFPKPSYLFALVAARLACREGEFTTASGRKVSLGVYVEEHNHELSGHALASLRRAMRWDEERYGREYDLDRYMVVAVDDFNMGAMENKGLNVFNSKYVLANADTATDRDYAAIEAVIGHEYFHNWTGNRVTLRDWFQLSLKEGLTVFREQSFSADMTSPAVKRIQDVRTLRHLQFSEDAGPMAHPVRPESYIEINNFYTATVYEKGAEVVRMYQTLLGKEGFRRGMDLYFERHDGEAVTTDDFLHAMADANDQDLSQFSDWYRVAGTPQVTARGQYDQRAAHYTLTLRQRHGTSPGQPAKEKPPLLVPIAMGLLDSDGNALPLQLSGAKDAPLRRVLWLRDFEEQFVFDNIPTQPVPSLLRGFSAPVRLDFPYNDEELACLIAHDSDSFNRWDAAQKLITRIVHAQVIDKAAPASTAASLVDAFRTLLADKDADPALVAETLQLPSESELAQAFDPVDVEALSAARRNLKRHLAGQLEDEWMDAWSRTASNESYRYDPAKSGARNLHAVALGYLGALESEGHIERAAREFEAADNMTDRMGALAVLANLEHPAADKALASFRAKYDGQALVLDKWFALQATSARPAALERVQELMDDPAFKLENPNRVRALIGSFSQANHAGFHEESGRAYRFVADQVLALDRINPQVAARLVACFTPWRRYDQARQALMGRELKRMAAEPTLSPDVYEIVERCLKKA